MRTYVITLSRVFMKSHKRAGEPTGFAEKLRKTKLHTIRTNYELWRKRFEEIEQGKACLSIRQWEGAPYRSKQIEIARLTKEDGIGIEALYLHKELPSGYVFGTVGASNVYLWELAENDGLDFIDWFDWFDKEDMISKPLPIIHFTSYRYDT